MLKGFWALVTRRRSGNGKRVRILAQPFNTLANHKPLTRFVAVIREIEDADRNWDPSARRRKDRKPAESKGEKPSPSRQSDAEMKTMPGSTNPNGSPLNVTNPKSTPVGTPKEMFPRGFY